MEHQSREWFGGGTKPDSYFPHHVSGQVTGLYRFTDLLGRAGGSWPRSLAGFPAFR
jgi:hypothetical protein